MTSQSAPAQRLRKNMKPRSQGNANCALAPFPLTNKPMRIKSRPPTMRRMGGLRQRDRSSLSFGGAADAAVILFFEIGALVLRDVIDSAEPGQLQSANVGDDRPAVFDRDVRPVSAHQVAAIGDDVKKLAIRQTDNARIMEIADDGHRADFAGNAVAIASGSMAG